MLFPLNSTNIVVAITANSAFDLQRAALLSPLETPALLWASESESRKSVWVGTHGCLPIHSSPKFVANPTKPGPGQPSPGPALDHHGLGTGPWLHPVQSASGLSRALCGAERELFGPRQA